MLLDYVVICRLSVWFPRKKELAFFKQLVLVSTIIIVTFLVLIER